MHDPTKPIPSPLSGNLPARRRGEAERLATSAGSGESIPRFSIGAAYPAYGSNATPERRGYRRTSRAKERAELLDLAANYAAKSRVYGVGEEVRGTWQEFVAAVDRIVGDV